MTSDSDGGTLLGSSYYKLITEEVRVSVAKSSCPSKYPGSHLVEVNSAEEFTLLKGWLPANRLYHFGEIMDCPILHD